MKLSNKDIELDIIQFRNEIKLENIKNMLIDIINLSNEYNQELSKLRTRYKLIESKISELKDIISIIERGYYGSN